MSDLWISQQTFVQNNLTIATPAFTKPLNSNEVEKLVRLNNPSLTVTSVNKFS